MTTLSPTPIQKFFANDGTPLNGGQLFTYVPSTTTKLATYTDSSGGTPNANPIILNFRGEADVWLDPALTYKYVLAPPNDTDPPTNPIWSKNNIAVPLSIVDITQQFIGNIFYPISVAELAAGLTNADLNRIYFYGDVRRYRAALDGITVDTTALQNWAKVPGAHTFPVAATALVNGLIPLVSNSTFDFAEGATILMNTAGLSVLRAVSKANILIRGGTIQQNATSGLVHVGLVEFNTCNYCTVEQMEFIGAQGRAVLLSGSNNCVVERNYIHNSLGSTTADVDSCDIAAYGASSLNRIVGNICYGGLAVEHGVMMQDPGGSLFPLKNLVDGNRVGPHKSYGILNYLIDHANTYCTIVNNEVEGITGTAQGGNSGAGIYNQGAGGTLIANNTIRNCCISTSGTTLLPAGIALNQDPALEAVSVIGNTILEMAQFYGIEVVAGPAVIVGNTIVFPTGVAANIGIFVNAASEVTVSDNTISIAFTIAGGHGIFVFANGTSLSNILVSNNKISGTSTAGIRVDTTGAPTITNLTLNGNTITGGAATSIGLQVGNAILCSINGNVINSTTVNALNVATCTQTRIANNVFRTTGASAVTTGGVCTASYFDKTNYWNGTLINGATGLICEQLAPVVPAAGTAAVGDRAEMSVPVVGQPKGWRCTVAGAPGTWVSEGNL